MEIIKQLTGQVWHGLQLLLPKLGNFDGLLLHGLAITGHPLLIRMRHHFLEILRVQGVEDVEEILTWWTLVLCPLGREKRNESWILLELRPDVAN